MKSLSKKVLELKVGLERIPVGLSQGSNAGNTQQPTTLRSYFPLAAVAVKLLPLVSKVPHPQPVAFANERNALCLRDVKGLFWTVPWARG